MPSEAVDVDHGQRVRRRLKDCPVVIGLKSAAPSAKAGSKVRPSTVGMADGTRSWDNPGTMTYDQLPDEWKEWLELEPLERFARSERMLVEYIAMGGSLDADPDPTSPFDVPDDWRPDLAHGRAGLRLLRRGAG